MQISRTFMIALLPMMAHAQVYGASPISVAIKNKYCPDLTVDYIVIGAGTAGSIVTKTLSDDLQTSVLALESGENRTREPLLKFAAFSPLAVVSALFGAPFWTTGDTIPQPNINNRSLLWVLGNMLGGDSQGNASACAHGTNQIYDQWQVLTGSSLWSSTRIQSLFKMLENYQGSSENPELRGSSGPLDVRQGDDNPPVNSISRTFINAMSAAAVIPIIKDYNDPLSAEAIGASYGMQYFQKHPTGDLRVSGPTAFLGPNVMTFDGFGVGGRKLRVLFNAPATRTLWQGNRAIGVEYVQNGQTQQAYARKGVVVCAGLYSSKFLMYSGIGDKNILQNFNIPVIVDNGNVGKNLANQYLFILLFTSNPDDTPIPSPDPNNFFKGIAWFPDPLGPQNIRQYHFVPLNPLPGLSVALLGLSPAYSRGTITINSSDPLSKPVIDEGALSDPRDLQLLKNVFKITIANLNTQLGAYPGYALVQPDPAQLNNDAYVTDFIKNNIRSNECYQSHCQMATSQAQGVVDATGLVFGTQNLYVADASIIPLPIDGTPEACAFMIGSNIAINLAGIMVP